YVLYSFPTRRSSDLRGTVFWCDWYHRNLFGIIAICRIKENTRFDARCRLRSLQQSLVTTSGHGKFLIIRTAMAFYRLFILYLGMSAQIVPLQGMTFQRLYCHQIARQSLSLSPVQDLSPLLFLSQNDGKYAVIRRPVSLPHHLQ